MNSKIVLIALMAVMASGIAAKADVINIVNAGFEDNQLSPDSFSGLASHPGWSDAFANVGGVAHPPLGTGPSLIHSIDVAPEGNQFGYARNGSGLIQTLTDTFDPSRSYTLSVDAATSSLSAALNLPGTDVGYRIQLRTSGGILADAIFTESGGTPRDDIFRRRTVEWNPGDSFAPVSAGQQLQILLQSFNDGNVGGSSFGAAFDDVQLDASAVPEPSTWALLTLAGVGFGGYRLRQKKKQSRTQ